MQSQRVSRGHSLRNNKSFAPMSGVGASGRHAQQRVAPAGATGKRIVALDFDGVVCDSVGESSLSAIKAATIQWPELFDTPEARSRQEELVEGMRAVRPVVETGYENIVQIRCLLEGDSVQDILDHWHVMLQERMQHWGLERSQLVELFGSVRDNWIKSDLKGWLAPNRIYSGVAAAVRHAMEHDEVYIVTTKQAHYTELLMKDMAGITFHPDRIFSQTVSGRPKTEVLSKLAERHPDASGLVFVEDKLSTLEKVCAAPGFEEWQLYLVDWGYNTPAERARANANERITVVDIKAFDDLMTAHAPVAAGRQ